MPQLGESTIDIEFVAPGSASLKPILVRSGLVLGGLLVALLLTELSIRIFGLGPVFLEPLEIPSYRLSSQRSIGYEYRPNYRATDQPYDRSHTGIETNSHGFRDVEFEERKLDGVVRILVLGDSVTAGNGIRDPARTYPKVLERLLNEGIAETRYQVLNMGVGGYHTSQEVETLRHKGLAFDPDYVLLAFCLNDFSTNTDGGVYQRLLELNAESGGVEAAVARDRWLLKHSRLAMLIAYYLGALSGGQGGDDPRDEGPGNVARGLALLEELRLQQAFRPLVFIVPAFDAPFDEYRYLKFHRRLREAAPPGNGIPILDLLPDFRASGVDATSLSRDGVHPNVEGHEMLAKLLLDELQRVFPELRR